MRRTAALGVLECERCGLTTLRKNRRQRYCPGCSGIVDRERKDRWQAKNAYKPTPTQSAGHRQVKRSRMVEQGAERSLAARASLDWNAQQPLVFARSVRVAVPFDYAASKNAIWRHGRGGHVWSRQEGREWREALTTLLLAQGGPWFKGKVWIDLFVEKPDHRGDAANVVDMVLDAVKDATGVDDRWYSIARLDWSIVKVDPQIIVGVHQEVVEDHIACSHCGRQLPYTDFGSNRSTDTGRARVCLDCSAPVRGRR